MLDPAGDGRDGRGVHRRGRGRAGGAVDDRQRHALPADAVRAGGGARQARGHSVLMAYAGRPEAGERALAPFRALATPLADMVHPMPYPEIYPPEDDVVPPARRSPGRCSSTASTRPWRRRSSSTSRRRTPRCAPPSCACSAGAMARVPADATAFAHRDRPDHGQRRRVLRRAPRIATDAPAWVEGLSAALRPGRRRRLRQLPRRRGRRNGSGRPTRAATWDRLAAVKGRYDPDNLFRLNQNVPPAFDGASAVDA